MSDNLKKIIKWFVGLPIDALVWGFWLVDRKGGFFWNRLCNSYERVSDNYSNYKLTPKKTSSYIPSRIKTDSKPGELAIVLQGIVSTKDDFTLESVRLYKKIFPGAIIIISTWENTAKKVLLELEKEGCVIVLSKAFEPCGFCNVNYQICTSLSGVRKAKELGAKYTLKNRSDLRIYKEFSFEYLKSLVECFPVSGNDIPLNGRIITLSGAKGQLFAPYWLQDFIYFGFTDDLFSFFDLPYDERPIPSGLDYFKKAFHSWTCEDMCVANVPEVYLTVCFLGKYMSVDRTVSSYWNILKRYFIIVNPDALKVLWNKYEHSLEVGCMDDKSRNINLNEFINIYYNRFVYEEWMEDEQKKYL